MPGGLDRRAFLKAAGGLGLLSLVPLSRLEMMARAASGPGQPGLFLDAHQLDTLRAVTARFIPGVQEGEPDPGAREAGCAEAIDALLAAFRTDVFATPHIHAGGPFSDRAGSKVDDFATFAPLDAQAVEGWRIRIEGPRPDQTFAAGVVGLQHVYRDGLAHLDKRAADMGAKDFLSLPGPMQDLILSDQTDSDVQTFVGAALANTLDAMYGPPEYGGNRGLVGWEPNNWPGDVQPRGYTPDQVGGPDPGDPGAPLSPDEARAALRRFMTALAGRPAPRDRWWAGRPAFERG
jgi:hypothetical protein